MSEYPSVESTPTVAFIGPGIMGRPMAADLVKAGFDGRQFPPTRNRLLAAAGGGRPAGRTVPPRRWREADAIITMPPDTPDVEPVALGPDGIVAARRPERSTWT